MIPLQNVYYLLCYAWDYVEAEPPEEVSAIPGDRVEDLLSQVMAAGAGDLLRRGLDRAYVQHDEDLQAPRGKMLISETLKRNLERSGRIACAFDDLSHDVLHNRLLRSSMLRLAGVASASLRRALDAMAARMRDVSLIEPAPGLFRRVQLHRNNARYRFVLHVCELAMRQLLPDPAGGGWHFLDFRRDERQMGRVFEAFVRNFLRREQEDWARVEGEQIEWAAEPLTPAGGSYLPLMKTDITLAAPGRKVIVDTKYYADPLDVGMGAGKKLRSDNLYQMLAYLENLRARGGRPADVGVLLYASDGVGFDLKYRLGAYEIHARSLNLGQPWQGIKRDLLAFSDSLRG